MIQARYWRRRKSSSAGGPVRRYFAVEVVLGGVRREEGRRVWRDEK